MNINKWNNDLKNHGYKTVEKYVELWNEAGEDKIDLSGDFTPGDVKEFINKNKKGLARQMRSFVFTIHKPFMYYESIDEIHKILEDWRGVDKSIFALEVGKHGSTLHIQGYVKMKTPTQKSVIIRKFNNTNIHIEVAKGTIIDNFKYINKDEGINNKIVKMTGDWKIDRLERLNYNVSEFVDFALDNEIPLTLHNIDKYCVEYRRNPSQQTIQKISEIINIRRGSRMLGDIKPIQTLVIFGDSGNGKSLLSEWLFNQVNLPEELIFKKAAAAKESENDWWSSKNILQNQAFFTEVDITFPKKKYLLSFIDAKDQLSVKGTNGIRNNFDHLIINATSTSMRYIYNATQNSKSFTEIYRRLLKGKFIYVSANPEWSKKDLSDLTTNEMMEKYPPKIYLMDTEEQKFLGSATVDLYKERWNIKDSKDFKLQNKFEIYNTESREFNDLFSEIDEKPVVDYKSPLYLHEYVKGIKVNDYLISEKIKEITKEEVLEIYKSQLSKGKLKHLLK